MRASQLPTVTSVLLTATAIAAVSGMTAWAPLEEARAAWFAWGYTPQQGISKMTAGLWCVLAGLGGGWLGCALALPPSWWKRATLLPVFGLLQLTLAGVLSVMGWAAEPFTATVSAGLCFLIGWLLNRQRHQRLDHLSQLGLLTRVSDRRIHTWLDRKKPLGFEESTLVASLVTLTVESEPEANRAQALNQAMRFLLDRGGCLEAIGQHHVQLWFGFPDSKTRPGRQAARALQAWGRSKDGATAWQASVVTGSIDLVFLGDGQATHLKAMGPWCEIGRIAATSHPQQIVVDQATHEMLDDDSWTCHPIDTDDNTEPHWYEISASVPSAVLASSPEVEKKEIENAKAPSQA